MLPESVDCCNGAAKSANFAQGNGLLDMEGLKRLAAPQGFEPRYADPESAVLPLNEGAARLTTLSVASPGTYQRYATDTSILLAGARDRQHNRALPLTKQQSGIRYVGALE